MTAARRRFIAAAFAVSAVLCVTVASLANPFALDDASEMRADVRQLRDDFNDLRRLLYVAGGGLAVLAGGYIRPGKVTPESIARAVADLLNPTDSTRKDA